MLCIPGRSYTCHLKRCARIVPGSDHNDSIRWTWSRSWDHTDPTLDSRSRSRRSYRPGIDPPWKSADQESICPERPTHFAMKVWPIRCVHYFSVERNRQAKDDRIKNLESTLMKERERSVTSLGGYIVAGTAKLRTAKHGRTEGTVE